MKARIRFHILSDRFNSPNGRAFVFPLRVHAARLRERGIAVRIFGDLAPDLADCDVLGLDSKFFRDWWIKCPNEVKETLQRLARTCALLWFDTTDSAGGPHSPVLPFVRRYYKSQLYRDRSAYSKDLYGLRLHTDFYHQTRRVTDSAPVWSQPITSPEDIAKLRVSWNSGLCDYSLYGPYILRVTEAVRLPLLLRFPESFVRPDAPRPQDISRRFGVSYDRETVAYQRREIRRRLGERLPTDKLNRFGYFRELRTSRVIVSPFGLGEITLKDFEVFLTGGMLLKPSMDSVETWPNLFQDDKTMLPLAWDLSDLEQRIEQALSDRDLALGIAEAGQRLYRHHIASEAGHEEFCNRVEAILADAERP